MNDVIYYCCDSSHEGPPSETETCFFCGALVVGIEKPVSIPALTPADLNPEEVSLYHPEIPLDIPQTFH